MGFNFTATGLITIIIGLIACFFGFRAKKIVILLIWFLIGFSVGQTIMPNFTADQTIILLGSAAIGLITGAFGYELELLSVFGMVGYLSGSFVYGFLNFGQIPNIVIAVIFGLLMGALSLKFVKPIIIATTAIGGGSILMSGINQVITGIPSQLTIIIEIGLIIVGLIFQFADCKKLK